jgi:hypothetical protein
MSGLSVDLLVKIFFFLIFSVYDLLLFLFCEHFCVDCYLIDLYTLTVITFVVRGLRLALSNAPN